MFIKQDTNATLQENFQEVVKIEKYIVGVNKKIVVNGDKVLTFTKK